MIHDILSVFKPLKSEGLKTFFIGESISILPEYYRVTETNAFDTPVYGWSIRSISGTTVTLVRGVLRNTQKLYIDTRYLKSE